MSDCSAESKKTYIRKHIQIVQCQNNPEASLGKYSGFNRKNFAQLKIQLSEMKESMSSIINSHQNLVTNSPKNGQYIRKYKFLQESQQVRCPVCQKYEIQIKALKHEKQELIKKIHNLIEECEITKQELNISNSCQRKSSQHKNQQSMTEPFPVIQKKHSLDYQTTQLSILPMHSQPNQNFMIYSQPELTISLPEKQNQSQNLNINAHQNGQPECVRKQKKLENGCKSKKKRVNEERPVQVDYIKQNEFLKHLLDSQSVLVQVFGEENMKLRAQLLNHKYSKQCLR